MFTIKQNDTSPAVTYTIPAPIPDLSGATVVFRMRPEHSSMDTVSGATAAVQDSLNGVIAYAWGAEDLDTAGNYYGEFTVTYGDSTSETFPPDSYIAIKVVPRI